MTMRSLPGKLNGMLLPGLDGTNSLGFLAALGVLSALDQSNRFDFSRLHWLPKRGIWVPVIYTSSDMGQDEFITLIHNILCIKADKHPALRWDIFSDGQPNDIRKLIADNPDSWSACIGIEPLTNTDESKCMSQIQTARKDYHVKAIKNLLKNIDKDRLGKTLLEPWDYTDPLEGLTLHIDPSEDRRHAYQWNQPNGDPSRKRHGNMIAANRLALEAFPFFSTIPVGSVGQTIGFKGRHANDTFWTWPIWSVNADSHVIKSLLALPELQSFQPNRKTLQAMGIDAVMRSQRILVGKTPNLTPAQRIA